jgi:hypothetical protein
MENVRTQMGAYKFVVKFDVGKSTWKAKARKGIDIVKDIDAVQ